MDPFETSSARALDHVRDISTYRATRWPDGGLLRTTYTGDLVLHFDCMLELQRRIPSDMPIGAAQRTNCSLALENSVCRAYFENIADSQKRSYGIPSFRTARNGDTRRIREVAKPDVEASLLRSQERSLRLEHALSLLHRRPCDDRANNQCSTLARSRCPTFSVDRTHVGCSV